jgi:hypothetical protein
MREGAKLKRGGKADMLRKVPASLLLHYGEILPVVEEEAALCPSVNSCHISISSCPQNEWGGIQKSSNAQTAPSRTTVVHFSSSAKKVRREGRPTMCVEQMANLLDDQKLGEKANEDQIHIIVYVRE